jgi:glucosamine 6-phosphate synthetase-like amidotransferase/phosphosugar isomerase protein
LSLESNVRKSGLRVFFLPGLVGHMRVSSGLYLQIADLQRDAVFTVPLQLFVHHVAVLRSTGVDRSRNLPKSVTVE